MLEVILIELEGDHHDYTAQRATHHRDAHRRRRDHHYLAAGRDRPLHLPRLYRPRFRLDHPAAHFAHLDRRGLYGWRILFYPRPHHQALAARPGRISTDHRLHDLYAHRHAAT